ncbi:MAG: hypothetical protein ACR2K6_04880 [Solirubrobacterales bacterium]
MRRCSLTTLIVAAAILSGCGGEDERVKVPAAGENTPLSTTPAGIEEGAPYDLSAQQFRKRNRGDQFDITDAYVEDNPTRCEGARTADVVGYATVSIGLDFPLTGPVSEILGEGCDAARQS